MRVPNIHGPVTLPAFIVGLLSMGLLSMPLPGQNNSPAAADAGNVWTGPRTPDGQPDVHGFFVSVVYGLGCSESFGPFFGTCSLMMSAMT